MDTKQLVEKFVKGEISEEQFAEEKAKLSPEDLVKLEEEAKAAKPSAVDEIISLRRGANKIVKEGNEDVSLATKLREENLASAKTQFFTELGIEKEEDIKAFDEGFVKFDSGSVTPENIIKDMRKFYAAEHSDDFFRLNNEKKQREIDAEEFNAQNGGANGSGDGGKEMKKVSKEVQEHMKASAALGFILTPEQAQRQLDLKKNGGHIT